jgi:hypothetical protein
VPAIRAATKIIASNVPQDTFFLPPMLSIHYRNGFTAEIAIIIDETLDYKLLTIKKIYKHVNSCAMTEQNSTIDVTRNMLTYRQRICRCFIKNDDAIGIPMQTTAHCVHLDD